MSIILNDAVTIGNIIVNDSVLVDRVIANNEVLVYTRRPDQIEVDINGAVSTVPFNEERLIYMSFDTKDLYFKFDTTQVSNLRVGIDPNSRETRPQSGLMYISINNSISSAVESIDVGYKAIVKEEDYYIDVNLSNYRGNYYFILHKIGPYWMPALKSITIT